MTPLEGLRVVEFGQLISAPAAARTLAGLGAEVIKVEPPGGEPARGTAFGDAIYAANNRGKRSITLDLKDPQGLAVAKRLVERADVVLQNMRPGAMAHLGLGPAEVAILNPRAVYGSVSGFGGVGPGRTRAGLDVAAQAESGLMWITGTAQGEPQRVGAPIVDVAASDVLAHGVLAALLRRERTGHGGHVEVSLLEVAYHLQATKYAEYALTGTSPHRNGNGQPLAAPAADLVRVADGHVVLSAYSVVHWARLCRAIGRPELIEDDRFADNARRVENRAALLEVLSAALRDRSQDDAVEFLAAHGLVAGAVRDYPSAATSPQAAALGIFELVEDPAHGALRLPRLPYTMTGPTPGAEPSPLSGADTAEILAELGFTHDET